VYGPPLTWRLPLSRQPGRELYRDHIVGHEMAAGALTDAALAERAKSDRDSVGDDL
jgi:hypothetical protein